MYQATVNLTTPILNEYGAYVSDATRTFSLADLFTSENKIPLVRALREARHLSLKEAVALADSIIHAGESS